MDAFYQFEIQIILFLQSLGEWLRWPMVLLSYLGTEEFYLFIAPALVWCVNPAWGLRTGLALMVSGSLNAAGKLIGAGPRPYWISDKVIPWSAEPGFGVPSGHAQNSVAVWGALASGVHKRWAWGLAILMAFLIGLSRLFLAMHFPHDVLVGWLLGAIILFAMLRLEQPVLRRMEKYRPGDQIIIALGFSLILILIGALARMALGAWQPPQSWVTLAARAPGGGAIDPLALSGLVSSAGVFFGLAAGAILLRQAGWYDARGTAWQLVERFLLGLLGILVLWYGLGLFLPRGEDWLPLALRFVRYTLVGGWVMFGAPMAFKKLHLAS